MNSSHRALNADLISANQFQVLAALGLREHHAVLDIGCGPLALGRLLIPFLLPGRYCGCDLKQSGIEDGIRFELGHELLDLKRPQFLGNLNVRQFGTKFDYIVADFPLRDLAAASETLQPDGLLVFSWPAGPGGFAFHDLELSAKAAGLDWRIFDWPHPLGRCWGIFTLPGCQRAPRWPHPDGGLNPRLDEFEVIEHGFNGCIDFAHDLGTHLSVAGWAIDPESRLPADRILISGAAGETLGVLPVDVARPDLAPALGLAALYSGFRAILGKQSLGSGAAKCYALVHAKGKAYRLAGALKSETP